MTHLPITKKQQEILSRIPQFRFLDRSHIQSFLQHRDDAQINKWLHDLLQKQYVKRIYDNAIIGKNRRTAIFYLENNGVRFIKAQGIYDKTFLHRLYWDKNRSETFIEHCLLLATICCELERKNSEIVTYQYTTESDLANPANPYHFLKNDDISVDLVFSKKETGKRIKHFLLMLIDETLPTYRIRNRIRKYQEFYFTNEWENNTQAPFPTLLLICKTKERMIYAKRFTKQLLENYILKDISFHFATVQDAKEHGVTGAIWEGI